MNKYYERARAVLKDCGSPLDQVKAVAEALQQVEDETREQTRIDAQAYCSHDWEPTDGGFECVFCRGVKG